MTAYYRFLSLCPVLLVYARWEFSFIPILALSLWDSWESTLINLYRILLLRRLLMFLYDHAIWGWDHRVVRLFSILVRTSSVVVLEMAQAIGSPHITLVWHGAFLVECCRSSFLLLPNCQYVFLSDLKQNRHIEVIESAREILPATLELALGVDIGDCIFLLAVSVSVH